MESLPAIRILESDNNRRGDLFGRLMADLFISLGYEQPVTNVHKTGREVDLLADHRMETRRAIAECKATNQPIGGNDLNKFAGVLDIEDVDERPVTGYFISLAGFTETALEQERKRRRKIITLDGPQVVSELIRGRILVGSLRATELAGRFAAGLDHLILDPDVELLAHERGLIWAVYYTQGKIRTHFVLIHADGTPLARPIADEVIFADNRSGGCLNVLVCLNPVPVQHQISFNRQDAIAAYKRYLLTECGYVQLGGLPTYNDIDSRRFPLVNLYVPLHLDVAGGGQRQPINEVLKWHPRVALLAPAGGGKSSLINYLAVSYADPSHRERRGDDLPRRDWLPVVIRCRDLGRRTQSSFGDLLDALVQREPIRNHASALRAMLDHALEQGRILLLVDGLDEIYESSHRDDFVRTIRTVLEAYPSIALVLTSRTSGFRHIAAHLTPVCTHASFSPFDDDDIRHLCIAWQRMVFGDTAKATAWGEELAKIISQNSTLKQLAVNPLLLTTLLLIQRWVGSLPLRRTLLYKQAIEVLLQTWNVENYHPIALELALPQLCYLAFAMMVGGIYQVSLPRLLALLEEALEVVPASRRASTDYNVERFVRQIEDRSGLLVMTGHVIDEGRLLESFGFCHLSFQEFLAAWAIVEGWYPGKKEGDTLVEILKPYLGKPEWYEVVVHVLALGGNDARPLEKWVTEPGLLSPKSGGV